MAEFLWIKIENFMYIWKQALEVFVYLDVQIWEVVESKLVKLRTRQTELVKLWTRQTMNSSNYKLIKLQTRQTTNLSNYEFVEL